MLLKISKFKNEFVIIFLIILFLVLVGIGVTYSYVGNYVSEAQVTKINANVGEVEKFVYTSGNELNLKADGVNVSGSTDPAVTLIAGVPNTINSTYDVYLSVTSNSFEYSDKTNKPGELIMKVVDPEGVELTSIPGLNYVTSGGVSGFDITELNSFITIKEDVPISSNDTTVGTTQTWNITVTYVDLDIDQTVNNNKSFVGNIILKNGKHVDDLGSMILENNGGAAAIEAKLFNPMRTAVSQDTFDSLSSSLQVNYIVENGVYAVEDDYGTSYFFRGTVDNNWIYFAGYYWRIVRITGDGSIKLMYYGATKPIESEKYNRYINFDKTNYNYSYVYSELTGYMYTIGEQHGYTVSSDIKNNLENWYAANLKYYGDYISDTVWCNDRTTFSGSGYSSTNTTFSSKNRIENIGPSLVCPDQRDAFTVDDEVYGNGYLTFPIGLITADEIAMAGIADEGRNNDSYLYIGDNNYLWTMSPRTRTDLYINNAYFNTGTTSSSYNAVPFISLKSNVLVSGTGTWDNPYIVEGLE